MGFYGNLAKVVGALSLIAGSSVAQEATSTNRVAAKTDWSVFVEDNPTECWGVAPTANGPGPPRCG